MIPSLIALWSEKMLDKISIFLNLLRFDLGPKMWSILENVPCALEKKVYSAFGRNVLKILAAGKPGPPCRLCGADTRALARALLNRSAADRLPPWEASALLGPTRWKPKVV